MIYPVPNDHSLNGPRGEVTWQQPALPNADWVVIWLRPVNLVAAQQLTIRRAVPAQARHEPLRH